MLFLLKILGFYRQILIPWIEKLVAPAKSITTAQTTLLDILTGPLRAVMHWLLTIYLMYQKQRLLV